MSEPTSLAELKPLHIVRFLRSSFKQHPFLKEQNKRVANRCYELEEQGHSRPAEMAYTEWLQQVLDAKKQKDSK